MKEFAMSERRACRLVELDRSSYRYEPRADHNAELREELVKLARQKPRYAYRRLHALLERRGHEVNVRLLRRSCRFMLLYGFGTQFTLNKEVVFYVVNTDWR
jgi:putative transposase